VFEQVFNGKHVWLSVTAIPIVEPDGTVEHLVVRFVDISERKHQHDKLQFLVESNKILSITTDFVERLREKARLTVPNLADWCTVTIANPDGTLSRVAIVHRDPSKVLLVEELANRSAKEMRASDSVLNVVQTGVAQFHPFVTTEMLERNGISRERLALAQQLQVCSSMTVPIMSRGKALGALSLAYAESGRHYTPEDLDFVQRFCHHIGVLVDNARLYQEIKKRDNAKDSFLATLSHELRNPLAPIKSALELFRMQYSDPAFLETVSVIEHQFDHLTKLLNDLLDVTRYSRGKIDIALSRIDLCDAVRHTVNIISPFLKQKEITLNVSVPQEAMWVQGDQTRIEQAIMNILHNAEKFTPSRGIMWVHVRTKGSQVLVSVRDTGAGIEPHVLANIFELGATKSNHTTTGLGIGLVLVKEIMTLHEGTVEAHSKGLGQGSEFTLSFPLLHADVAVAGV
jgi:signal transduction histidine kinase